MGDRFEFGSVDQQRNRSVSIIIARQLETYHNTYLIKNIGPCH